MPLAGFVWSVAASIKLWAGRINHVEPLSRYTIRIEASRCRLSSSGLGLLVPEGLVVLLARIKTSRAWLLAT
jgi:hypothetical protein